LEQQAPSIVAEGNDLARDSHMKYLAAKERAGGNVRKERAALKKLAHTLGINEELMLAVEVPDDTDAFESAYAAGEYQQMNAGARGEYPAEQVRLIRHHYRAYTSKKDGGDADADAGRDLAANCGIRRGTLTSRGIPGSEDRFVAFYFANRRQITTGEESEGWGIVVPPDWNASEDEDEDEKA